MAKLKGPLFSLGASGQIGKALVFFPWKGLNVVREHVVPSNPKTADQTTQRSYMTEAVAAIHTAQGAVANSLASIDVSAYALWASVVKTATTWFNQAVKNWIDVTIAGNTPCIYSDAIISSTLTTGFSMELYLNEETGSTLAAGKFYFGSSKTALINSAAATIGAGINAYLQNADLSAFLTAGVKHYVQFRPDAGDGCEGAYSGIYHFTAT